MSGLGNLPVQAFGEGNAGVVFDGGIFADFFGEVEILRAGVGKPYQAGAGAHDVANFSCNDGEQDAEFESRSESAAEIVERGEAFQSEELRLALAFDGFQVGERGACEAAGLFQKVRVFGGEFAGALVENLDHTFGALCARQRDYDGRFDAGAAGFIEMLEIVGGDLLAADAAGFGGLVNVGEQAFADGFALGRETLAGFVPARAAHQAFGAFRGGTVGPDENGASAEGGTDARGESFQQGILVAARQRHARKFKERGKCFHGSPRGRGTFTCWRRASPTPTTEVNGRSLANRESGRQGRGVMNGAWREGRRECLLCEKRQNRGAARESNSEGTAAESTSDS